MKQLCSSRLAEKNLNFWPFFLSAKRGELEPKNEIGSIARLQN